jgi:hypothetical protein
MIYSCRHWLSASPLSGALIGIGIWLSSLATPAIAAEQCSFLNQPQRLNTLEIGDVIYLGALPDHPYWVIIPGHDPTTFAQLRLCIADALQGHSVMGDYLLVGNFYQRAPAEDLARTLRDVGYSAQVIHRSRFR